MSRISNNSFAVNSNLEQKIEIAATSTTIPISSGSTLDVDVVGNTIGLSTSANQTTANTSLANIDSNTTGLATEATLSLQSSTISFMDSKITQGYDAQVASGGNGLQQNLCYGLDTGGNLDAFRVDASGHLEVTIDDFVKSQATMANSFPVVIASDQSAIPVTSTSSSHSGTQANLMNAVSASNGTNSNVITTTSSSKINIFGNTSGSGGVEVQQSADNVNFYNVGFSVFPDGNGNFSASFNQPANYWRIQATETATITATLLHNA